MADQQPPSTIEAPSIYGSLAKQGPSDLTKSSNLTDDQQSKGGSEGGDANSDDLSGKSNVNPDTVSEDGNGNDGTGEDEGEGELSPVEQHFDNKIRTRADFPLSFFGAEVEAFAKLYWQDPTLVAAIKQDSQRAGSSQVSLPLVPPLNDTILAAIEVIQIAIADWEAKGTEPKYHMYRFETADVGLPDHLQRMSIIFVPGHGSWDYHTWSWKSANKVYDRIDSKLAPEPNSLAKKLSGLRLAR